MSTAVLISGQMRTFTRCYPTQRWQIFRHYGPNVQFFVSCLDDLQADSVNLLKADYENVYCERYTDVELPPVPQDKGSPAPYANATSHERLMLQHWGVKRTWDFYRKNTKIDHDVIIRIRPDLWIHRFEKPVQPDPNECFCPWWGKFGGVNDRLAIMGPIAAAAYFGVFDKIGELLRRGCPFHPESLTAAAMELGDVRLRNVLMTEFSTERVDGTRRWAEIVNSDLAELIRA